MAATSPRVLRLEFTSAFEMLDFVQVVSDYMSREIGLDDDSTHWVGVAVRERSLQGRGRVRSRESAKYRGSCRFVAGSGHELGSAKEGEVAAKPLRRRQANDRIGHTIARIAKSLR